jgi:hypothetical protein
MEIPNGVIQKVWSWRVACQGHDLCPACGNFGVGQALHAHPSSSGFGFTPTKGEWAAAIAVVADVGVGVGFGIYFAVHHGHSLTGCAATSSDSLQLVTDGGNQTYSLGGDVAGVKAGDRVRISGKNDKKVGAAARSFVVSKLLKDFGPCKLAHETP